MTPLLLIEPSTKPGAAAVAANNETVPKGDGVFADFVDAAVTLDEQILLADGGQATTADAPDDDVSPELAIAQPDVPQTQPKAASRTIAEPPKRVASMPSNIEIGAVQPQTETQPEQVAPDGKNVLPDKPVLATKSSVQAIVEGHMPRPQADPIVKTVPVMPRPQGDTSPLPIVKEPIVRARPPVAPTQANVDQLPQISNTPSVAVQVEPKLGRDTDRRLFSADQIQQPTDEVKLQIAPPPPKTAPVLTPAPTLMLDLEKQAAPQVLAELDIVTGLGPGERAGATGAQTVAAATAPMAAQTGQQAAHQIAVAITQQGGRVTEIALNPEELGRVRLSMTANDTTIMLNVLAERPETTDLLRRNIDALAQEFRALGYDNINFSFGGDGAAQADTHDTPNHGTIDPELTEDNTRPIAQQSTTGLDLRL